MLTIQLDHLSTNNPDSQYVSFLNTIGKRMNRTSKFSTIIIIVIIIIVVVVFIIIVIIINDY